MYADLWFVAGLGEPVEQAIVFEGDVDGWDLLCIGTKDLVYAEAGRPVGSDDTCGTCFFQRDGQGLVGISCFLYTGGPGFLLGGAILFHSLEGFFGRKFLPVVIGAAGRL